MANGNLTLSALKSIAQNYSPKRLESKQSIAAFFAKHGFSAIILAIRKLGLDYRAFCDCLKYSPATEGKPTGRLRSPGDAVGYKTTTNLKGWEK
jgi:hypothetical protein